MGPTDMFEMGKAIYSFWKKPTYNPFERDFSAYISLLDALMSDINALSVMIESESGSMADADDILVRMVWYTRLCDMDLHTKPVTPRLAEILNVLAKSNEHSPTSLAAAMRSHSIWIDGLLHVTKSLNKRGRASEAFH